jgi:hypothetical protein
LCEFCDIIKNHMKRNISKFNVEFKIRREIQDLKKKKKKNIR